MKLEFFNRPAPEQAVIIRETAARRGLLPVMVEKDFWVSWTLAVLFAPQSSVDNWFSKAARRCGEGYHSARGASP